MSRCRIQRNENIYWELLKTLRAIAQGFTCVTSLSCIILFLGPWGRVSCRVSKLGATYQPLRIYKDFHLEFLRCFFPELGLESGCVCIRLKLDLGYVINGTN